MADDFQAANPSSTISMTSATSAYGVGQMIANNATGTSVTVPSFNIPTSAGVAAIQRIRVSINDSTSTAWGNQQLQVDLWTSAPTFASGNGDRGAFLLATGSANHIATFQGFLSAVQSDGVYGELVLVQGANMVIKLPTGTTVYWTAIALSGSGVTGASKTLTITPELLN